MERKLYLPNNGIVALTRWLARSINAALPICFDYRLPITLMGIAEGGLPFTKLLSSFLEMPHYQAFLQKDTNGSFLLPPGVPHNQIILADCIFDTGKTFVKAHELFALVEATVSGVVLLQRCERELNINLPHPRFTGFLVPGREFFVGFGLDDKEGKNRELPDIYSEGEIEL